MPHDLKEQWLCWKDDLKLIAEMKIPRCLKHKEAIAPPVTAQLHHFCHASEEGLGTVSYLRLARGDGSVQCSLVMAKAKLVPLKTTTISRLELTTAVVAAHLDRCIRQHLKIPLMESMFWTDSMIVLQYLNNEDKRFQTFVANKVVETCWFSR